MGKKEKIAIAREYLKRAKSKLKTAQLLLEKGILDDAISRAYYAAFLAAYAILYLLGETPKTHEGLLHLFGIKLIATGIVDKKYGKILNRLRQLREESDYAAFVYIDEEEARKLIYDAKEFVAKMEEILNEISKENN